MIDLLHLTTMAVVAEAWQNVELLACSEGGKGALVVSFLKCAL